APTGHGSTARSARRRCDRKLAGRACRIHTSGHCKVREARQDSKYTDRVTDSPRHQRRRNDLSSKHRLTVAQGLHMAGSMGSIASATKNAALMKLVDLAALPAAAADNVVINGTDPVFPTRYRIV